MDILFWSGGKDAYLALQFYKRQYPNRKVHLFTTFDGIRDWVPHQNIAISNIRNHAQKLGLTLHLLSLPRECPNEVYLQRIEETFNGLEYRPKRLIFGDLRVEEIRQWREDAFGQRGYSCCFPIWHKDIHTLLPVLQLSPVTLEISAVSEEYRHLISVGERYDQQFVKHLNYLDEDIDLMGEKGEFHTKLTIHEPEKPAGQHNRPAIG